MVRAGERTSVVNFKGITDDVVTMADVMEVAGNELVTVVDDDIVVGDVTMEAGDDVTANDEVIAENSAVVGNNFW